MTEAPPRRRWLRVLAAVVVSAGLVVLMLRQLDPGRALDRLTHVRWSGLLLGLVFSVALQLARGVRFHALTVRSSFRAVTAAIALQTFLLRVTPLRLGELSLPYLLAKESEEPAARTLVSLILVRILELWMVLVVGLLGAVSTLGGNEVNRLWSGVAVAVLLTALLATFRFWLRRAVALADALARRTDLQRRPRLARWLGQLHDLRDESSALDRRKLLVLFVANVAVVALQNGTLGAIAWAFGLGLHPMQMLVGVSLAQIVGSLPIGTVGSVGTHETGWTLGFLWVGVPLEDAVMTAIASQLVTLGYALIFAVPSWLVLGRRTAPGPRP